MTRIREKVSGRIHRRDERQALNPRPGVPVLDAWRTSIDQDARPARLVMFGDMTGLLCEMPVE